jgi:hypothetical protein
MNTCSHDKLTRPVTHDVRIPGSQHIAATTTIRVCLECGHALGEVRIGGFNPLGPIAYETDFAGPTEIPAWKALRPHLDEHRLFDMILTLQICDKKGPVVIAAALGLPIEEAFARVETSVV